MPAALEWDKVTRIDPASLFEYDKTQMEEVVNMLVWVITFLTTAYNNESQFK